MPREFGIQRKNNIPSPTKESTKAWNYVLSSTLLLLLKGNLLMTSCWVALNYNQYWPPSSLASLTRDRLGLRYRSDVFSLSVGGLELFLFLVVASSSIGSFGVEDGSSAFWWQLLTFRSHTDGASDHGRRWRRKNGRRRARTDVRGRLFEFVCYDDGLQSKKHPPWRHCCLVLIWIYRVGFPTTKTLCEQWRMGRKLSRRSIR